MKVVVISEDEMKKLRDEQERHALEELRASTRIASIADANERFAAVTLNCDAALRIAEDAYVTLFEDDGDSFEVREDKADKLDEIERQSQRCIGAWENQLRRVNWEARQAQKK